MPLCRAGTAFANEVKAKKPAGLAIDVSLINRTAISNMTTFVPIIAGCVGRGGPLASGAKGAAR
jgi:hypothetical protein